MNAFQKIIKNIKSLFAKKANSDSQKTMSMNNKFTAIPFDAKLIKIKLEDVQFTELILPKIQTSSPNETIDTFDCIDLFFKELPPYFNSKLLSLFLITPYEEEKTYLGFAYLENKTIVPLRFSNEINIAQWNSTFFKDELDGKAIPLMHKIVYPNQIKGWYEYKQPKNIGQYIVRYAPSEFKISNVDIALEKQKFLEKYINIQETSIHLENLKTQFLAYLNTNQLKPIDAENNDAIYQEFNSLSKYAFPKELQTLFEIHNGIENNGFLSAAQVLREWKTWKGIFDDTNWTLAYLTENNYADNNKTLGMYTNPYWVPFYNLGGGNFYAIDYAPNKKGTSGQIIQFGADADTVRWIASDISGFIQLKK